MVSDLWKNITYKTPIRYFLNTYIREYDLSKANISALLYQGRISKEEYNTFYNMDKQSREVAIGKWIREDKSVYKDISNGIRAARKMFVQSNQIDDYNIVSIKNDALFIQGQTIGITTFEPAFEFKIKNEYNVYLQLGQIEVYYKDQYINGQLQVSIDIKGISENNLIKHRSGMLDLICDICYRLQREDITDTLKYLSNKYELFIQRQLPKEYYRAFDEISVYTIQTGYMNYTLDVIDDRMIPYVNIDANILILRDLMSIVCNEYQSRMNKNGRGA